MKLLDKSKYLTFAALIVFIACELFLRVYKGENMVLHHFPMIYASDSSLGYRGIPNAKGYIRRPSIEKKFTLNNQGFFGPDFYPEHPDSIFRIMIFGSSVVEGIWGVNEESFPTTLDRLFKEKGYKVEVINCGISGVYRVLQNIALIREMSAKFKPDLVLFEHPIPVRYFNYYRDVYNGYSITFAGDNSEERWHSKWITQKKVDLLKKYQLVTDMYDLFYCLRYWTRSSEDKSGTVVHSWVNYANNTCDNWQYFSDYYSYSHEKSAYLCNDVAKELDKIHSKLALFEYGESKLGETLRSHPEMVDFSFISLNVPLERKDLVLELDDHPNAIGYRAIADTFYKVLSQKYIPTQFCPQKPALASADLEKK